MPCISGWASGGEEAEDVGGGKSKGRTCERKCCNVVSEPAPHEEMSVKGRLQGKRTGAPSSLNGETISCSGCAPSGR